MQKKSIYAAYTGGTIGMQRSDKGYIPASGHSAAGADAGIPPPEMPDFTIHEYAPGLMDSSDDAGRLAAYRRYQSALR